MVELHSETTMTYRIEHLVPEPPLLHNCHRGTCCRRAKFTVFEDDRRLMNLCVHHAVKYGHEHGLSMPKQEPPEE